MSLREESSGVFEGLEEREPYVMGTLVVPSKDGIVADLVDVHETFYRVGGPQQSVPLCVGVTMEQAQSTLDVREGMGIPTRRQGFGQNM